LRTNVLNRNPHIFLAVNLLPENATPDKAHRLHVLLLSAHYFTELGDFTVAAKKYEKMIELDKELGATRQVEFLNAYADFLWSKASDFESAEKYYLMAMEEEKGKNPTTILNYAECLLLQGIQEKKERGLFLIERISSEKDR
jgi:Tfp pilus assembly protein PilF